MLRRSVPVPYHYGQLSKMLHTDYPVVVCEELLTAADELKLIEPDNYLILIVDALSLATESKNLTVAKEKMISG